MQKASLKSYINLLNKTPFVPLSIILRCFTNALLILNIPLIDISITGVGKKKLRYSLMNGNLRLFE